jgi:hypothetical protein
MRKQTLKTLVASIFLASILFAGCKSTAQKEDDAEVKVEDAKEDLKDAQENSATAAQKTATAEEWKIFKLETELKIKKNELQIANLKTSMNKPGKAMDSAFAQRIANLEQKNIDLKNRVVFYEKNNTDWNTFKSEFNHDMEELSRAFGNLVTKNTN